MPEMENEKVDKTDKNESEESDSPIIDDNIVRIQLRKPCQRKWELRTRNLSPGIRFPTIQLFDCDGNLLVETNDENISIKSSDFDDTIHKSQSLKEKDYKHYITKNKICRKRNTISGDNIYTRVYRTPSVNVTNGYVVRDSDSVTNIPNIQPKDNNLRPNKDLLKVSSFSSEDLTDFSSYKSSDNEIITVREENHQNSSNQISIDNFTSNKEQVIIAVEETDSVKTPEKDYMCRKIHKSKSSNDNTLQEFQTTNKKEPLSRSKSGLQYFLPQNKVSFLNTYLKSLDTRKDSNPFWLSSQQRRPKNTSNLKENSYLSSSKMTENIINEENTSDDLINIPTDDAADFEMKKRLRIYRRGLSEIDAKCKLLNGLAKKRRHSVSGAVYAETASASSSESVDEADLVLSRLKRRIFRNRQREKRRKIGDKYLIGLKPLKSDTRCTPGNRRDVAKPTGDAAHLRSSRDMGSNISQHSCKGLKGRRARSSGDLCNGDSKSQTEPSVCGSVVGDMGWNRSLPNHLDGNRHLAEYSRVNNNYAEFGTYNRAHPKGGRGLRYRFIKSGSDAEPVWKLQDPGFDQGYGSERSPEEDYMPPIVPRVSLEQYEAELRTVYPFINDENTFTVVVEKDGRGLGMSVCGGGGLVRIRRLYPPQPAWRTGRLAPKDLLLSANGVPLAGLSTYEALEVLRTASPRVELRVCRPPEDVLESVTPPDPPTPPARTPHPPPLDPLNCHPMHARLSQTTSSATTSSSEGRGRREASPEVDRRGLHLPVDYGHPLPIYNLHYGEFDIVMTKVNGSLGFTLRKEDHSALGHYVRALVREPALSDGRIQPGDRIVAVNDTPMSNLSHAEAVAFLRSCGSEVRLRLYRDHAATPLSPTSPKEEVPADLDAPKPKTPLRAEAVSMLCDLAARRLTPDAVDGSRSPCLSPRKFRRLTKENHYEQPNVHPAGYQLNNINNEALDAPNAYQEEPSRRFPDPPFLQNSDEPVSMPAELSTDEKFKHSNPAYQSAVLHSDTHETHRDDGNGLKKWKGVALSPDNERKVKLQQPPLPPPPPPPSLPKLKMPEPVQKENIKPAERTVETNSEPTIVTVELNRGWNSRLGFSVQSHPESGQSYISAVYSDSVAARDGRLRRGDVILQVNDENVTSMKTPEVIDLLRILRGSICITVLRPHGKPDS